MTSRCMNKRGNFEQLRGPTGEQEVDNGKQGGTKGKQGGTKGKANTPHGFLQTH